MKNFSVTQETVRVDIAEWCSADIDANRETIFVVGDVHGCADLLDALLNVFGRLAINEEAPRRLVFLGDLINRGPHTIKVLERWAHAEPIAGVTKVDRLMGNHEQLLLLALRGDPLCARAYQIFVELGGDTFLQELRNKSGMPAADLSIKLLVRRSVPRP
jgi:serine/threonine protein phosphatase 1